MCPAEGRTLVPESAGGWERLADGIRAGGVGERVTVGIARGGLAWAESRLAGCRASAISNADANETVVRAGVKDFVRRNRKVKLQGLVRLEAELSKGRDICARERVGRG